MSSSRSGGPQRGAGYQQRQQRLAEMRRQEQARERRVAVITISAAVVLLAAIVGGGWWVIDRERGQQEALRGDIEGIQVYEDLTQEHVTTEVDYPMTPPAGGDHDAVWQNCNGVVYDGKIRDENAVHALEHGSVWVTYRDDVPQEDIDALAERVSSTPYTLMSPYPEQEGAITLTAWGHQLTVDSADDERVEMFFTQFRQGPQTPEPGAACTGGTSALETAG
ncbi:DUF3105 domain-containing protein [Allostreptomyces psammosilenae]|uniref:DUF3105 domain-containing protein n=1 Tax=Allostreptomyces psammosilenae TaxID=1892865 RepID=A0A852ZYU9_9ACTN|nr:DUF3105 domain-containing protein [Allostreptomyces psammosilenae]NYI03278.1 hypothetical protein [Allostreptomyces psammosilenae]